MDELVAGHIPEIQELCRTHYVESFSLFGSASKGNMNKKSDVDFLVRFSKELDVLEYADNYFDLIESLQALLHREVDLISEKSLKNPILIQEINNSKVPVYES